MTEFKAPKVLQRSDRVKDEKGVVVQLSVLEYDVEGTLYPKLQIKTFKVDEDDFPASTPKSINLPVDCKENLLKCFDTLKPLAQ